MTEETKHVQPAQNHDRRDQDHATPEGPSCPFCRHGKTIGLLVAGFVLGAVVTGLLVWQLMPGMMINRHESRFGLDETVARLQQAIEEAGWTNPAVRNMNESMAKRGVQFDRQVRIVELCNAEYAKSVLETDRHLATLMPCAFAVYEDDDGKVYVSGMNTGLMGKMFGGNVAEVMGGKVAKDEKKILSSVVKG